MKTLNLKRIVLFLALVLVQFTFASNDPGKKVVKKNAKAQKVFVVLKGIKSNDSQLEAYKQMLTNNFNEEGVEINYLTSPNAKDNEVFKQAIQSESQYLIVINQTHQYYIDGATNVGGSYKVMYYPLKNGKQWETVGDVKMNIQVKASISKANEKIVTKFLDKL